MKTQKRVAKPALVLKRETLQQLGTPALDAAVGGKMPRTADTDCYCLNTSTKC